MTTQPGVGVRLFMAGGELVKQTFAQIGDAGRRMWAAIASGEEKANPALKGLSAASREAKAGLSDLAANAGSAGRILISLGPAGFAAAAGLGAMVIGLSKAADAVRRLDELGDVAVRLNLPVDEFVRYRAALQDAGGEMAAFQSGVEAWQLRVGQYFAGLTDEASGFGKALSELGISRADLEGAQSFEEQILLLADALEKVSDKAARAALADKLGIRELLPLLSQGSAKTKELAENNRDLGDRTAEAAEKAGPLNDRLEAADKRINAAADSLSVRLGPALASVNELFATFLERMDGGLANIIGPTTLPEKLTALRNELFDISTRSANLKASNGQSEPGGFLIDTSKLDARAEEIKAEIARVERRMKMIDEINQAITAATTKKDVEASLAAGPKTDLPAPGDKPREEIDLDGPREAATALAAATRALDAALEKARGPLGAYISDLADLEKAAAALPGRQDDVREATVSASRSYLEAAAKAADLNNGLEALEKRDPGAVDEYAARLADLAAQRNSYPGGSEAFQQALDAETRAFLAAAQGADRATKAREAFETLWADLATPQERAGAQRAADIATVNKALAEGEVSADRAAEALRRIEERYDAVGDASRRAAEKGEGWITILDGLKGGAESFEDAIVSLIQRLIELTATDFFTGANKGDFWGSLTGAFDDLFGFGGGGGGGGGSSGGGWFSHGGRGPGERPTFERTLPKSVWDGAPRHHQGWLARNERAVIIEDDESILTPGQMGALYRQGLGAGQGAAAAMAGKLLVTLRDESDGRLQVEQREGQDGTEIDILVRDAMASNINSGGLDAPMRNRFGLTPKPT